MTRRYVAGAEVTADMKKQIIAECRYKQINRSEVVRLALQHYFAFQAHVKQLNATPKPSFDYELPEELAPVKKEPAFQYEKDDAGFFDE